MKPYECCTPCLCFLAMLLCCSSGAQTTAKQPVSAPAAATLPTTQNASSQNGTSPNQTARTQTPQTLPSKAPGRVRTQLDGFELSPKSGKGANQVGGASRGFGGAKLYAPNSGKAFSTNPVFFWSVGEPGVKTVFHLFDSDGQPLYEASTSETHFTYPGNAPPLKPGTSYRWSVTSENDILGSEPQPVMFTIVSGAEREAIQAALKSALDGSSVAQVFMDHRIWYDAVAGYTSVLERIPDNVEARSARASLYEQLPATSALATADWSKVH